MELIRKNTGHKVVGVLQEETPSCWHLKPVEYRLDDRNNPVFATNPNGLWFRKTTWERFV